VECRVNNRFPRLESDSSKTTFFELRLRVVIHGGCSGERISMATPELQFGLSYGFVFLWALSFHSRTSCSLPFR